MAGGDPAVTVLLPVRNAAATLPTAAASILAQTWTDLELLLVDDGSDDATGAVLARLERADPRVRVLRPGRVGLVAALDLGLHAATGVLLARMDADDRARPERLARQVAALRADPDLVLLGTAWQVTGPAGEPRRHHYPPPDDAALRAALARANPLAHPTVMLRREAARAAGGYRPAFRHAEDYDLWLRLAERGRIACLPQVLLEYRQHAGQVTWADLEQRILSELGAHAAARRRAEGRPDGGDGPTLLDHATLRRMGMSETDITAGLVARCLGAAKDARAARHWPAMASAARLGLDQPGLRPRTRLHLRLLQAQARLRATTAWA